MTLSDLSIKRPVFAWMIMFALIVFGGIAFVRMGVSKLPDVDAPIIAVSFVLAGASPEIMETDIVDIAEGAFMTIPGIKSISSTVRYGSGRVVIEFNMGRDMDVAQQDVQGKLLQIQRRLPKDMDPVSITKTNPEDQPIIYMTLESETLERKVLMSYVRDVLRDQFTKLSGVGDVTMGGYVDPNLRVWISDSALRNYDLSVNDVIATIGNEHSEIPAGFVQSGPKEFNVRTLGEASTVEEFKNLNISARGGQPNYRPIKIGQVARVEEGIADVRSLSRSMGKSSVSLAIIKQRGVNEVDVARGVREKVKDLNKKLPAGMLLAINFDNSQFTERAIEDMRFTLVLAVILTALVCWLFLGSFSSTFNVFLAIPTSVIGTFIFLYFSGFTLNTFTLLALSLVIGIVVDDAIMMMENIIRHREHGMGKVEAALIGAREITFPAIATSIAILAIFLPVIFMRGVIGRFFFQFGVTVGIAVMLSLLEAITLTPMRCSQFLSVGERTTAFGKGVTRFLEWLKKGYHDILVVLLQHRWKVIIAAFAFFAVSFFTVPLLRQEFMPTEDQGRFMVRVQTRPGSALEFTDARVREVEAFLSKRPEVERYFSFVGGFGGNDVSSGNVMVSLKDKGKRGIDKKLKREPSAVDMMNITRAGLKGITNARFILMDPSVQSFGVGGGRPVEFQVQGPVWETLISNSQMMMDELGKTGLVADLDTSYRVGQPEIQVVPDRNKATAYGVSVAVIGQVINAMIGGVVVGDYAKNGHRYDIRVKLENDKRDKIERIKGLYIRNNRGELTPLYDVVKVSIKPVLQSIQRRDRQRAITISANIAAGKSQQKAIDAVSRIARQKLPAGYFITLGGNSQVFQDAFSDLIFAMLLGIIVAYMVLASQFNSYLDPITIIMALPFTFSGAFLALLVTGQSLNIYSLIGLILLMGLVKKNSILLVDFTNRIREDGEKDVTKALLKACPVRLRPILMTSMAIIAGALPIAFAIGPSAESRIPMGVTILGGMIVSTLLTLFVVPCGYSLFSQIEGKKAHHLVNVEQILKKAHMG
ncbi:MAG: efflux RND transporter permease subunit [Spirochaetes bacterium]|nr:efflux RND transporter permease subunit [Spirochaetota bacterium]